MCQNCEKYADAAPIDQDKFNDEVREATRIIDGKVFIDADTLALVWSETMLIGVMKGQVEREFMLRAWVPLGAVISRAEALAEVDLITAPVSIPENPQDTTLS